MLILFGGGWEEETRGQCPVGFWSCGSSNFVSFGGLQRLRLLLRTLPGLRCAPGRIGCFARLVQAR